MREQSIQSSLSDFLVDLIASVIKYDYYFEGKVNHKFEIPSCKVYS